MARISKELDKRHDGKTSLTPRHVIVVRVASFAFRFETAERLRESSTTRKKRGLVVALRLRPWPQTSDEIGENSEEGK